MADAGRARHLTAERLRLTLGDLVFDALAEGPPGGPLVLLLHGFPQTSYEWRHQLPALAAAGYRAVAPDQRGYSPGARPDAVDEYRADRLAADVLGFADELGAARFHLVGHDWGGILAWLVAAGHPDRVRSLASISSPHPGALVEALASPTGDQRSRSAYVRFFRMPKVPEWTLLAAEGAGLRALFHNTGFIERSAVDEYVGHLRDPGALTAVLNWYRALDVAELGRVGPVSPPTLFVWSGDDPALGREAAEATRRFVEGPYTFVVLEEAGHWLPEDMPGEVNRALLEHLAAWSRVL